MKNSLSINSKIYYKHPSLNIKHYSRKNGQSQGFNLEEDQEYELSYILKQIMLAITDVSLNILSVKHKVLKKIDNKVEIEDIRDMNSKVENLSLLLSEYVGMLNDDEKEIFRRAFFRSLENVQKYENNYDEYTKKSLRNLDICPIFIPEWNDFASCFDSNTGVILFYAQEYFSSLLKFNLDMFEDEILGNGLFKSIFKVLDDYSLLEDIEDLSLSTVLRNNKSMETFYYLKVCFDYPIIREKVGLKNVYKQYLTNVKIIEANIDNYLLSIMKNAEESLIFFRNLFIIKFKDNQRIINNKKLNIFIKKVEERLVKSISVINKNLKSKNNYKVNCFYEGSLDKVLFNSYNNYGSHSLISNWLSVLEKSYNMIEETDKYELLIKDLVNKLNKITIEPRYELDYLEINLRNYLFLFIFQDMIKLKSFIDIYDCYNANSVIKNYLSFIERISILKSKKKLSLFKKNELHIEFIEHNEKIIEILKDVIFNDHEVKFDVKLILSLSFDDLINEHNDVQYKDLNLIVKSNLFNNEEILVLLKCCLTINSVVENRLSVLNDNLNEVIINIEKNKMKKQVKVKSVNKSIKKF